MISVKPAGVGAKTKDITGDITLSDGEFARLRTLYEHINALQRDAACAGETPSLCHQHAIELLAWRKYWSKGLSECEQLPFERTEHIISDCIAHRREQLFLGNLGLHELPEIIWHMGWLRHLHIGGNRLGSLSSRIGHLRHLTHLTAGRNQLGTVPQELGKLERLEVLDLSANPILEVPDVFAQMQILRYVYLNQTLIIGVPKSLSRLPPPCTVLLPRLPAQQEGQPECSYPFASEGPAIIHAG
jgi:hypothetical protein